MKQPKQRVERRTLYSDEQIRKIIRGSTCELKDKACALIIYEGCVKRDSAWRIQEKDYNSQMKLLEIKDSEGDYLKTIKLSDEANNTVKNAFIEMHNIIDTINENGRGRGDGTFRDSDFLIGA